MPFSITTRPFGPLPLPTDHKPLTEYILQYEETGEFATIIPEFGGMIRRLVLGRGKHLFALLKAPESPQALFADESYASALLFPFPSRIRHGIYAFEGEKHALRMNEASRDNALHGLVHGKSFSVIDQETTPNHASLTVRYDYSGDAVGYPFPFALTVNYELTRADWLTLGSDPNADRLCALRITYSALNTGTTRSPVAFGWHPYFTFTSSPIDELTLSLPGRTAITLDDAMIPNGQKPAEEPETLTLKDLELDTPFKINPTGETPEGISFAETVLDSPEAGVKLVIGQETGEGKLNYLVCYTPPRRDSIAIEPLTANVDSFNNGDGLVTLNPGETLSGSMWVRLK
ncbi:aldose 1-epimerase [Spirosoma agri]|jgi:aldose 1-epimerase|uniref:Aldose 1-epimerase n=1 Tax=Spirosoma agri TaxID=1987381 RepID=A0A6M0IDG4_9BACT|nr:aldose 1-epimerase [Spirosoma agri]NEU66218.1 aldose 1-epimerase [Spirosoma agri]